MSLPSDAWQQTTIGAIAKIKTGKTPSKSGETGTVPFFKPGDLDQDEPLQSAQEFVGECGARKVGMLPEGTVLVSCIGNLGKIAITGREGCCNQQINAVLPVVGLVPKFVYYWAKQIKPWLEENSSATTISIVNKGRFEKAPFAFPRVTEQRRIVAKLDSVLARSKAAREELGRVPKLVERYKQALLAAAFRGELTAEWRSNVKSSVAVTSTEDPRAKRSERVAKKTPALTPDHLGAMWSLPEKWQWRQIGDIAFVTKLAGFEYTKYVRYEAAGDLDVLKAENAGPNGFRQTVYSRVVSSSVGNLSRSRLSGGELLIVFVGAGTGNVAIVPEESQFFLGPNIGMVRPSTEISSEYLELFFRYDAGRRLLLATSKAVAQPSLSMGAIRSTPVAVPSVQEQAEIVRRVQKKFAQIDVAADQQKKASALLHRLEQASLSKAFSAHFAASSDF